ncbi:hypothetical protein IFM89_006625 [Coptis chinensis]|uniref:Cytochrome P450 n=1 Tax=Coptis chinensis TaxID=261450 RepID=A0A835HL70_9MAGN|nr:hypothetical protein IFM89_006625 [Coptis chinensis]
MIKSISESAGPLNLTEKLFSLTYQITCRVALGKNDEDRELLYEFVIEALNLLGSLSATDIFPYFGWIIDKFTGFSSRLGKCFSVFDAFYQKVINEHLDPKRKKEEDEDIIDVLLGLRTNQSGAAGLTISHIKGLLMNIFFGGVDTSTSTMTWAMTELVRKPETMKKVQYEIRNCIGKKGKVEESDINQLQYLKMVVKETLRLHPPGTLLGPRESMNHCNINGYDIFPKTRVMVNVWAIGRSSEYWENPEEFFPERFMNKSIDFRGQDFEFLPFGSGRRVCPGMNMGLATIELALANLLYSFNWELSIGVVKEDINMDEQYGVTVCKKFPLHLVPIKHN